ncbi:MarR family winged helix-turn-helix transcriptional regulator [Vibrio parahaemolyticus]
MFKNELPSDSVGLQFWAAYTRWHSKALKILKPLNINHTQFVILASVLWCKENNKLPTQAEIVHITGLDKMTLSKSMRGLVAKELIIKDKDNRDSRSFSLKLTQTGESLTKTALTLIEKLDQQYFGGLKDKETLFISLLQEIRK